MAWSSIGTAGSNFDKTAGSSVQMTVDGVDPDVGEVVIVAVAKDNTGTTDTNTNEVTSVQDDQGNTWTKLREYCNGNGSAGTGAVVAVFYTIVTSQMFDGDIIQANFSDSPTASAISAWRFSIGAGSTLSLAGSGDRSDDISDAGSITISGLSSTEYLFLRVIASERDAATALTTTASYTAITHNGTSGGSVDSNMSIRGEFRILTGTGDTSDPTAVLADHASTYLAILETAASSVAAIPILSDEGIHSAIFGGRVVR